MPTPANPPARTGASATPPGGTGTAFEKLRVNEAVAQINTVTAKNFEAMRTNFFKDMEDTIKNAVKDCVGEMRTELDEVKTEMGSIRQENDELKGTVEALKVEVEGLKAMVMKTDRGLEGLANEEKAITSTLKATNVVLYGVNEGDGENTMDVVKTTLTDVFGVANVENVMFRDIFRMGKANERRAHPRPVKIQMLTMSDKQKIMGAYLSKRKSFLDKGFRMRDDLPKSTRIFRSECYKYFERIMQAGHTPSFRDNAVRVDMGSLGSRKFYKSGDIVAFVNALPVFPDA